LNIAAASPFAAAALLSGARPPLDGLRRVLLNASALEVTQCRAVHRLSVACRSGCAHQPRDSGCVVALVLKRSRQQKQGVDRAFLDDDEQLRDAAVDVAHTQQALTFFALNRTSDFNWHCGEQSATVQIASPL
jgi:hypothetical protein